MKSLIIALVLTAATGAAQANSLLVARVQSVADAKNVRIVDIKAAKVPGAQHQLVKNPNYPCTGDNEMVGCNDQYVQAPVYVNGYVMTIQFDTAQNGDMIFYGDGEGQAVIGTRTVTFEAQNPMPLSKDRKARAAQAQANFNLVQSTQYVQHDGKGLCHQDVEGYDDDFSVCYSPYISTEYTIDVYTK